MAGQYSCGHIQFQIETAPRGTKPTLYPGAAQSVVLITATRTANNPAQIYYNGVLQRPQPLSCVEWQHLLPQQRLVRHRPGSERRPRFNGLIDEAQIYSTALTAAQVQAIYNAETPAFAHRLRL